MSPRKASANVNFIRASTSVSSAPAWTCVRFLPNGRLRFWVAVATVSSLALLALIAGAVPAPAPRAERQAVAFLDVTRRAGITFGHFNGATGKRYMPETMGSGVAVLDYDQDTWMDIFLVNGGSLEGPSPKSVTPALYRNNGDGTFSDVTRKVGLAIQLYGMGAAVADYNNDGFPDLYLTALGPNLLFRNNRDGTFTDVTAEAGVGDSGWGSSAAWLDADNDGALDLFVGNYVRWTVKEDKWCGHAPGIKSYCTPELYPGNSSRLFRNLGQGRFQDMTEQAGIYNPEGKALGIAVWDFDGNGLMDLVIAEDTQPDKLYLNRGHFGFDEVGLRSGFAVSESGLARAGMGIDVADVYNNGQVTVAISNFSHESIGFYSSIDSLLFADYSSQVGIGQPSLLFLGFGLVFLDYDLDGWQDLLVVNGHIDDLVETYQTRVTYRQSPLLFRNMGTGKFRPVGEEASDALRRSYVARGVAAVDFDNDGDLDLVITENGGPAHLLRNEGGNTNNWIQIQLVGVQSNRDGNGARVTVGTAKSVQQRFRRSGSSYLSQSDPRLTFGLGSSTVVDQLEVRWPSGLTQVFERMPVGRLLVLREGSQPEVP
ncbi:CRTAC1 family protein [Acidobacteria bacterium AH-259-A15]|nr:CRTAC1 family protein [Acidobacteria bacterium AH-259-A15]